MVICNRRPSVICCLEMQILPSETQQELSACQVKPEQSLQSLWRRSDDMKGLSRESDGCLMFVNGCMRSEKKRANTQRYRTMQRGKRFLSKGDDYDKAKELQRKVKDWEEAAYRTVTAGGLGDEGGGFGSGGGIGKGGGGYGSGGWYGRRLQWWKWSRGWGGGIGGGSGFGGGGGSSYNNGGQCDGHGSGVEVEASMEEDQMAVAWDVEMAEASVELVEEEEVQAQVTGMMEDLGMARVKAMEKAHTEAQAKSIESN
ncbi:keratin, type II cytoskeletal 1 [Eucalyptus grandis]|uniref:keratin, type II cytoskeletal 1 n=1 Tax=Eucalyptus grandis TaxID=71139 RepID=UPI00192F0B85|nr:keratin, type II cytoskeletal 1 [Eucalyptus grandis]